VRVTNLRKLYSTKALGFIGRNKPVTAIDDLSFDVPKVSRRLSRSASRSADLIYRERSFVCWEETVRLNQRHWAPLPNSSILQAERSPTPRISISVSRPKKTFSGTNSTASNTYNYGEPSNRQSNTNNSNPTWISWLDATWRLKSSFYRKACRAGRRGSCSSLVLWLVDRICCYLTKSVPGWIHSVGERFGS
jgi:hypothetical protein